MRERYFDGGGEQRVPVTTYVKHAWSNNWIALTIVGVVMLASGLGLFWRHIEWFGPDKWNTIEAAITVATLLTAIAVWWVGVKDEWLEGREPRISVLVRIGDRELAQCAYAPLLGDPRGFAQQIGAQMLDVAQLKFFPVFDRTPPRPEFWDGRWIQHQSVTITLKKAPLLNSQGKITWNKDNAWGQKLIEQPKPPSPHPRRYIANAFSLGMLKCESRYTLTVDALSLERARELAEKAESVVGHESTCELFSKLLERPVPLFRTTLCLCPGEELIVGQYSGGRLDSGATELPDGAKVQWVLVTATRAPSMP